MKKHFIDIIKKNKKGSMSIESTIVLLTFLMLFLTIFSVLKIYIADYKFNEIVNDATLMSGRSAYIFKIMDDGEDNVLNKINNNIGGNYSLLSEIVQNSGIGNILYDIEYENIQKIKEDIFLEIIKIDIRKRAVEKNLNPEKIEIISLDIPGFTIGKDNSDIRIKAIYKTNIKIPFLKETQISFEKEARIRCWINGGNGIYGSEYSGLNGINAIKENYEGNNKDESGMVFITKTGRKYHTLFNCLGVNRAKTLYETTFYDAINDGYGLCKFCMAGRIDRTGEIPIIVK